MPTIWWLMKVVVPKSTLPYGYAEEAPGNQRGLIDRFSPMICIREGFGSREAVSKTARFNAPATQARLRETAEILNRILPWCRSVPQAFSWFRSQPIPAFGGQTPEDLVRAGRIADLKDYLAGLAAGGYA